MSEPTLVCCSCEARACFDALRDRYTIPPDMAVLDWLDQAAKAWEELAEQQTCDRCTKLAALVYDAYIEGWDECETKTAEGYTTTGPSMEWEYSTARDDRCKIIGLELPILCPICDDHAKQRAMPSSAIVRELREAAEVYSTTGVVPANTAASLLEDAAARIDALEQENALAKDHAVSLELADQNDEVAASAEAELADLRELFRLAEAWAQSRTAESINSLLDHVYKMREDGK